jgi:hypothetical protein
MTESDARKAFNTARSALQTALTQYQDARASLHRVTGEFIGADPTMTQQFSSAMVALEHDSNNARHLLTDC